MRKFSFKILYDVFFNKLLLNEATNKYFDEEAYDIKENDKAFIKREVNGIIENLDEIDKLISKYSKVKIEKLNKDVLIALRIGAYEILYMDKVPDYATINECVNIIKKSKSTRYASYVNAILRNISRSDDVRVKNDIDIKKNCYFRIYNDKNDEVLAELRNKNISYEDYNGDLDYKYSNIYIVNKYKDILDTESFKDGNVIIEDASSVYMIDKLASFIECDKDAITILDACSAPGGKILSLIDILRKKYKEKKLKVYACDISRDKLDRIDENIKRLKISENKNVDMSVKLQDASIYDEKQNMKYDIVICDAPCTGLGVIDKKPDIKLNFSEEKMLSLVKLQATMLDTLSHYVKDGGILSYSTCTTTKEENFDNIDTFLRSHIVYKKIYEKQIMPHDKSFADGFYMCFMRRNG